MGGIDDVEALPRRGTQRGQVGAGAECRARPGHDDGVDAQVGLGLLNGIAQLLRHGGGHRVASLRVVHRDQRDVVDDVIEHQICHGTSR